MRAGPRLLATGFGPFPGAPDNPTEALMRALARRAPETFGASAFRTAVLKTDYRRSWAALRRLSAAFEPDVVVHFGLSAGSDAIHIERVGRNALDVSKPDVGGPAPASGVVAKGGPEILGATLPAPPIVAALRKASFEVALSDDAGRYVCNATLYRSLRAAPASRRVGLVHVPPAGVLAADDLETAACIILRTAAAIYPVRDGTPESREASPAMV